MYLIISNRSQPLIDSDLNTGQILEHYSGPFITSIIDINQVILTVKFNSKKIEGRLQFE